MKREIKDRRRLEKLRRSQPLREAMWVVEKSKEVASMNRKLLRTRDKDKDTVVVLYELPDNAETPYVTWCACKDSPDITFWGHYFDNMVDAVYDFLNR